MSTVPQRLQTLRGAALVSLHRPHCLRSQHRRLLQIAMWRRGPLRQPQKPRSRGRVHGETGGLVESRVCGGGFSETGGRRAWDPTCALPMKRVNFEGANCFKIMTGTGASDGGILHLCCYTEVVVLRPLLLLQDASGSIVYEKCFDVPYDWPCRILPQMDGAEA